MKLLTIPKFFLRILRWFILEIWRQLILIIIGVITILPTINIILSRRHGFYKSVDGLLQLDLWKLIKRGL